MKRHDEDFPLLDDFAIPEGGVCGAFVREAQELEEEQELLNEAVEMPEANKEDDILLPETPEDFMDDDELVAMKIAIEIENIAETPTQVLLDALDKINNRRDPAAEPTVQMESERNKIMTELGERGIDYKKTGALNVAVNIVEEAISILGGDLSGAETGESWSEDDTYDILGDAVLELNTYPEAAEDLQDIIDQGISNQSSAVNLLSGWLSKHGNKKASGQISEDDQVQVNNTNTGQSYSGIVREIRDIKDYGKEYVIENSETGEWYPVPEQYVKLAIRRKTAGWWDASGGGGVIGDDPADILDRALKQYGNTPEALEAARDGIVGTYLDDWDREPTEDEIKALVDFCTMGEGLGGKGAKVTWEDTKKCPVCDKEVTPTADGECPMCGKKLAGRFAQTETDLIQPAEEIDYEGLEQEELREESDWEQEVPPQFGTTAWQRKQAQLIMPGFDVQIDDGQSFTLCEECLTDPDYNIVDINPVRDEGYCDVCNVAIAPENSIKKKAQIVDIENIRDALLQAGYSPRQLHEECLRKGYKQVAKELAEALGVEGDEIDQQAALILAVKEIALSENGTYPEDAETPGLEDRIRNNEFQNAQADPQDAIMQEEAPVIQEGAPMPDEQELETQEKSMIEAPTEREEAPAPEPVPEAVPEPMPEPVPEAMPEAAPEVPIPEEPEMVEEPEAPAPAPEAKPEVPEKPEEDEEKEEPKIEPQEEEPTEGELSEEQIQAITEFVEAHPDLDDDEFHEFAKSLGIDPDKAEEIVYQMVSKESSLPISGANVYFDDGFGAEAGILVGHTSRGSCEIIDAEGNYIYRQAADFRGAPPIGKEAKLRHRIWWSE